MTRSMHSVAVFNFVNTKQTKLSLYIPHTCTMHSTTVLLTAEAV